MSFIHANFWNKKVKTESFNDLRIQIKKYHPDRVNISVRPEKNGRSSLNFDLSGSFRDIDKELKVLQKKFGRM